MPNIKFKIDANNKPTDVDNDLACNCTEKNSLTRSIVYEPIISSNLLSQHTSVYAREPLKGVFLVIILLSILKDITTAPVFFNWVFEHTSPYAMIAHINLILSLYTQFLSFLISTYLLYFFSFFSLFLWFPAPGVRCACIIFDFGLLILPVFGSIFLKRFFTLSLTVWDHLFGSPMSSWTWKNLLQKTWPYHPRRLALKIVSSDCHKGFGTLLMLSDGRTTHIHRNIARSVLSSLLTA